MVKQNVTKDGAFISEKRPGTKQLRLQMCERVNGSKDQQPLLGGKRKRWVQMVGIKISCGNWIILVPKIRMTGPKLL